MITIIDHSREANPGSLFVIWDLNDAEMPNYEPSQRQLLDALMDLEYIADFRQDDRDGTADVKVMVDGTGHWIEFERWLADEIGDKLCTDILNHHLKSQPHV